ncbi:PIR Superfamily Protein [Plasmodium ovale wallikeri]|uniref:PIR Superfamily Protein n=1 Tax=Plasmodium ovale wallikeri TaxID=864142 RepID=A0A1A9AA59_PLAOA|nr:PIR Superfamily Protein [Plasmodium ovale wallikeri]SBT59295.1 PIR Superfamily Protein [Plasmodium ovale wallikeri]
MSSIDPDIYSFFVSFTDYKKYEEEMKVRYSKNKDNTECEEFSWNTKKFGDESANDICIKFKILRNVILSKKRGVNSGILDNNDYSYLNYWLNDMSKNATSTNKITIGEFRMKVDGVEGTFAGVLLHNKLYDIIEDDYQNIKLLEYLYLNYYRKFTEISGLKEGKKILCFEYVKELFDTYKKGIIQCPHDNSNFCKALEHFKGVYNKLYLGDYGVSEKCTDVDLFILPTYSDVSLGDKITAVGSILGPSFGTIFSMLLMYKFTPFGQWIRYKMGTNKEAHSNLYEKNDELLLDNSDSGYINADVNPYRISYDSITNY